MSAVAQEDLNSLTNDQLRARLLQHGLGNMPVTNTTRQVLLGKLRKTIEGQKSTSRRETMHVVEKEAVKPAAPASRKTANRRNTINVTPAVQEEIVPIAKPKNMRRSGRITPTLTENGNEAIPPPRMRAPGTGPIAVPPSENDIIELDEDSIRETYVIPKRTSRSPSLGKSQTVITSFKTEVAKPMLIVESDEEEEEEEGDEEDDYEQSGGSYTQNNIYPQLPTNGFKNLSPKKSLQSSLRRTTTHTANYEPTSYQPQYEQQNYRDVPFKAPLSRPAVPAYTATASSSSTAYNRRYTTNSYNEKQRFDDDESATEHSDIDAPYLSDFTKRLSQLRPEPLDRKIIADVKQQYRVGGSSNGSSLWQSFSNLVIAFGSKFGTIILAGVMLMLVVFIYVFFIMA